MQVCEEKINSGHCARCRLAKAEPGELRKKKNLPVLSTTHMGALEQGTATVFLRGRVVFIYGGVTAVAAIVRYQSGVSVCEWLVGRETCLKQQEQHQLNLQP